MIVKIVLIQKNPGNSNSEGKRKTVRVIRVDCKIQFAMLKIYIYWLNTRLTSSRVAFPLDFNLVPSLSHVCFFKHIILDVWKGVLKRKQLTVQTKKSKTKITRTNKQTTRDCFFIHTFIYLNFIEFISR